MRRIAPALVFAAFVAAISYRVTPNHGVLMYGDNPYFWPEGSFDGFSVVQSSFLGYIRLVGMQTALMAQLPHLLSTFLPDSWSSYLLTYGLVYATCLTYYFVAYKLSGSTGIGYLAGLFIVLNTVTLEYLVVQPSHIFAALIIYALTFYLFVRVRERFGVRHALVLAVMSLALTHPFLWVVEIVLLASLFVFLRIYDRQRVLRHAALTFTLIILLASFWLIPFLAGTLSTSTASLYAGNEASVFEGVRAKVHHVEAFELFQYPGTWQSAVFRGRLPHLFYFATLAFVTAVFVSRGRRGPLRRLFLVLFAIYLLGFTLGLGPNSAVTGRIWQYAFNHLPGFGFLRTFSRFLNLSLVALVLLVVCAFHQLRRDRFGYYPQTLGLFLIALLSTHFVFFTGDLNGTATAGRVPSEYTSLNARFLDAPTDFSVITFPNIEYEAYQWNANRNQKAYQQITYFKEFFLKQPVIFNRLALHNLNISNEYFPRLFAYDKTFNFYPQFDDDLNRLNPRYVLVHKDLFDILRVINGLPNLRSNGEAHEVARVGSDLYVAHFSSHPQYRLVEDNEVFTLYENMAYRPVLRAEEATFQKINDTTYRVHVFGLKHERAVTLLQRFDNGWQIYPQRISSRPWCRTVAVYERGLTECAREAAKHDLMAATRLLPGRTLKVPHAKALGYANEWRIDASSVRSQLSREYYTSNPDGSVDLDFLIYFRPQSYFYLGLIIALVTVSVCLVWAIWSWSRYMGRVRKLSVSTLP